MLTLRLNPDRLSTQELYNLAEVLHDRCVDCIERGVAETCCHRDEIKTFLDSLSAAVDDRLRDRQRVETAAALGIDDTTGEWLAGS